MVTQILIKLFAIAVLQDQQKDKITVHYYKYLSSTMRTSSKQFTKRDKVVDLSKQDDFLFNKTPILSSALHKLKNKSSKPKPHQSIDKPTQPKKKVKKSLEEIVPSLVFTPLQKDLYNFYTINRTTLKNMEIIQEPKFQIGSLVLTAICDRGIGGKYLVSNLFRNKKAYIDYKQIAHLKGKEQYEGIEAYSQAGNYVVGNVVKSRNPPHIQLSLIDFPQMDEKMVRVGQIIAATIKSKEELGCILEADMCKKYQIFLPKSFISEEAFENLEIKKQVLAVVKIIDTNKHLIKVTLPHEDNIPLNLQGVQEEQMSKLDLDQFVFPGTLVNTKIVKVVKNGLIVKFLKIFIGFIHADHLLKGIQSYTTDDKIAARIIYLCNNPPVLYLSERHADLSPYQPKRQLYSIVEKPEGLEQCQGSYFSRDEEFYVHPSQLHSQIDNIGKFWVKENNYFEKYQIMSSRKLGLRVGEVSKTIPFSNFKVIGEGDGSKFRVMCLDVWNKVLKVSYDEKILKCKNLLFDVESIVDEEQYCGFIKSITQNGVIIEFCNNIKGILPANEVKINELNITEENFGEAMDVYISQIKKSLLILSLVPPTMRKQKSKKKEEITKEEETTMGIIQSIDKNSINPIYVRLKNNKIVKICVFDGIKPAALSSLPIIQNLEDHFEINQKIKIFRKKNKYYLYPPEQLSDKELRICRVVAQQGSQLRLQIQQNQFKNCHICQVTDLIVPYPLSEKNVGEYCIGRTLSNGGISLRDSIVRNGIPKNMKSCLQLYKQDEMKGDYRNRILTVGSAGLKEDMVVFGYIKSFTEKGCFVSLTSNYAVRIEMRELSDEHISDKASSFPQNKLILLRLISEKIKENDPNNHLFDGSSRQSIIKNGYPINDEALMTGLTVSGIVTGYTKGKALIKIDGSRFTGIMHPHDVEGFSNEPVEKQMKLGTRYKMKITEYSNDGRRLIRLSTLPKYFNKYKGVELDEGQDKNAVNLWENYQKLVKQKPPVQQEREIMLQENEQDDYVRMKKLLEELGEGDEMQEEQRIQEEEKQEQNQQNEQSQDQQQDEQQQEMDEQINEDEEGQEESEKEEENKNEEDQEEIAKRLAQFRKMNHQAPIYQSIVLANDSSESHLQYISAMAQNPQITPLQIRQQFMKSIHMLTTIQDKENMWIAWLNMELILGGLKETIEKAIKGGVGLTVYNRILEILKEKENWDLGYEFAKKLLKKFNRETKAYIIYLKFIVCDAIQNSTPERTKIQQILRRASQCLSKTEAILIQSQYGKILYEEKQGEKARTVFGQLTTKYPKRTDLWCMFVDLELKHGSLERVKEILERALTMELKKKKMITMLNKYYQVEKNYGTEDGLREIEERAKKIAEKYTEKQSDDE